MNWKRQFACAVALLLALAAASAADRPVFIRGVTIIDGTGAAPQAGVDVVIAGGRIAQIGPALRVSAGAQVVEGRGKFLIPGMWDMHAHPAFAMGSPPRMWGEAALPLYIANGVTGIRDMGGDWDLLKNWREKIEAGALVGPHIVAAGPILDGPTPNYPGRITVRNSAEAREAVRSLKQRGVDFIKVHTHLSRESYFAIAGEAKKQGLPFAGHVTIGVSLAEASDAGQKSIEHLNEGALVIDCSSREAELREDPDWKIWLDSYDPVRCHALFQRFRRNGTWQDPTLTTLRNFAFMDQEHGRDDPLRKYMPKGLRANGDHLWEMFSKNRSEELWALGRRLYARQLEMVGDMNRAGVRLLAGTDVAYPGFDLHGELELLVKAGLTPMQALQAATRNPAEYLARLDSSGTIAAGKVADLVLLDADPLADIGNTRKIAAVVSRGKLFTRADLDALLARAEAAAR